MFHLLRIYLDMNTIHEKFQNTRSQPVGRDPFPGGVGGLPDPFMGLS